jgi:hypothetical protein
MPPIGHPRELAGVNLDLDRGAVRDAAGLIRYQLQIRDDPSESEYIAAPSMYHVFAHAISGYLDSLRTHARQPVDKLPEGFAALDLHFAHEERRTYSCDEIAILFALCFGEDGHVERPDAVTRYRAPKFRTASRAAGIMDAPPPPSV